MTDQDNLHQDNPSGRIARAFIDPADDVIAGRCGTWRIVFAAGEEGIAVGGGFRIDTDTDSDWGTPQFTDSAGPEYASIKSPAGVSTSLRTTGVKSLQVTIHGRNLRRGEQIAILLGDMKAGGAGSRAQTFVEEKRFFWIDVDAAGNGEWTTLKNSPALRIRADKAVRMIVVAPSMSALSEPFRLLVRVEDRWGNPADSYRGTVRFAGEGIKGTVESVTFTAEDAGARWIEGFSANRVGVLHITAADADSSLQAESNPVICTEHTAENQLHWADPHGGQVVLNSKIAGFFRHARDVAGVQFVGYQRNADVISAADWEEQQRQECEFYDAGRFVPIPGFEWSGKTWEGGHHNIYFRRQNQPARRNLAAEEMFQDDRVPAELAHIQDVYAVYRNTDTIITPHIGGEHSDISYHDPSLEPAVEITSSHGSFEWMLKDAIRRGYRLGVLGGSDCYTGRPGDDRPGFQQRRYAKSGVTGIYAKEVTLEAFFEAMHARRTYATTGARIVLSIDGDGNPLGSHYTTSELPTLTVAIAGTAPLERVELYRGLEVAYQHPLPIERSPRRIRILWNGSSRMTSYSGVIWDGVCRVSGAKLVGVSSIRFDSPRSHVVEQTDGLVRWHAWGCGYPMGLILDLHEPADTQDVTFHLALGSRTITGPFYGRHGDRAPRRMSVADAEQADLCFTLDDLQQGKLEQKIGVLERAVTVELAPESTTQLTDFCVQDDEAQPGENVYWLKVTQLDGEMAWSSPIYSDYAPAVGMNNGD